MSIHIAMDQLASMKSRGEISQEEYISAKRILLTEYTPRETFERMPQNAYVTQVSNSGKSGYVRSKSGLISFVLWLFGFIGICGLHRFYLNRPFTGLLYLFTFGLLGVGQLLDLLFLGSMVRHENLMNSLGANQNVNTVAPVFNVQVNVPSR